MAAQGGGPRGFEPRRSTTDDEDPPWRRRRSERSLAPVRLAPRGRVHEARDRLMKLDHRDAPLIACDARPDLVEPTLARLDYEERVGDMGSRHTHQVGIARGKDLLAELDAIEPTDREHREVRDRSFDAGREVAEGRPREVHVGP